MHRARSVLDPGAFLIVFAALIVLPGCVEDDVSADKARQESAEAPVPGRVLERGQPTSRYSGQWRSNGGALLCDGYLTRDSLDDHCSAGIPEDWQPFEFDGKTYYTQPLSGWTAEETS